MAVSTRSSSQNRAGRVQGSGNQQVHTKRPLLRGWLHAGAVPFIIPAGIHLIDKAPTDRIKYACLVYLVCAALQFTVSGIYNIPTWDPETRLALRKLDHASIYLVIAATYTPFCVIASGTYPPSMLLLLFMWTIAIVGFATALVKKDGFKSKAISSISYMTIGWCGSPAVLNGVFLSSVLRYNLLAGLSFSIGGIIYALHWPNPVRGILEYHEVFHLCTIIATAMFYKAILEAL
jgi:hemolysin III